MRSLLITFALAPLALTILQAPGAAAQPDNSSSNVQVEKPFRITVIDRQTKRGVPMVELTTTNNVTCITDSAGVIAFNEPGLNGLDVFFTVKGHGYTFPKDGFGFAGKRVRVTPGGSALFEVDRVNVAERIYRITGGGIYRDSILLGDTPPIREPALNGQVFGQDSVQNAVYNGKLYWFWGDTNRPSYPLGQFSMSGAVSELPSSGGLDPNIGVNLTYFIADDGFSRPMIPIVGQPGPVWADGFLVVNDPATGRERMICHWIRVKDLGTIYEQGIAEFNDEKQVFEPTERFPNDERLYMRGHPVKVRDDSTGVDWFYFPFPYPLTRVKADYASVNDLTAYESYTCLKPGAPYDKANPQLDRDADGKLVWAWKKATACIQPAEQNELIQGGFIKPDEALIQLRDVESGAKVQMHAGSVYWNDYRNRWIMIGHQVWGTSSLGEVWFAEADSPVGPWVYARKIVTHDNYSFYNVRQHPEFDQDGGRIVYFEGTYTTFMTNAAMTPRYDYNQIMYKLDLSDPRLTLPVAVYSDQPATRSSRLISDGNLHTFDSPETHRPAVRPPVADLPFFTLPAHGRYGSGADESAFGELTALAVIQSPGPQPRRAARLFVGELDRPPGDLTWKRIGRARIAGALNAGQRGGDPRAAGLTGTWTGPVTFSTGGTLDLSLELIFDGVTVRGSDAQALPTITGGSYQDGRLTLQMVHDDRKYTLEGALTADGVLNAKWRDQDNDLSGTWTARLNPKAGTPEANLLPLWEYRDVADADRRTYSTSDHLPGLTRAPDPLCFVWESPFAAGFLPVEWDVRPLSHSR